MECSTSLASRLAALEHIDPQWAWHHGALLKLRQKLLHAISGPLPATDANEAADYEQVMAHETVLAELCPPAERLNEVDAALGRIRAHTYGQCEATMEPIPAWRLRTMPWTRFARPPSERTAATSPSEKSPPTKSNRP